MLKVNNFLSEYEYIPNPVEITDKELQKKIAELYLKFHPGINFELVDFDDYETIMGLITGVTGWSNGSGKDYNFMVIEYGTELLRRKIRDLIFKAY